MHQLRRNCWPPARSLQLHSSAALAALLAVLLAASAVVVAAGDDAQTSDDACVQTAPCRCLNRHGLGIDLQPLSAVKYLAAPALGALTFFFHPCADTDMQVVEPAANKTWTCAASTLCVFNQTANATVAPSTFTSLGKAANTEFHESVTHRDRFYMVKSSSTASGEQNK